MIVRAQHDRFTPWSAGQPVAKIWWATLISEKQIAIVKRLGFRSGKPKPLRNFICALLEYSSPRKYSRILVRFNLTCSLAFIILAIRFSLSFSLLFDTLLCLYSGNLFTLFSGCCFATKTAGISMRLQVLSALLLTNLDSCSLSMFEHHQ